VGVRFFAHVQTGPGAHPASCRMGIGSFPGVKRPGRGALSLTVTYRTVTDATALDCNTDADKHATAGPVRSGPVRSLWTVLVTTQGALVSKQMLKIIMGVELSSAAGTCSLCLTTL
jgi:hypothetical protein